VEGLDFSFEKWDKAETVRNFPRQILPPGEQVNPCFLREMYPCVANRIMKEHGEGFCRVTLQQTLHYLTCISNIILFFSLCIFGQTTKAHSFSKLERLFFAEETRRLVQRAWTEANPQLITLKTTGGFSRITSTKSGAPYSNCIIRFPEKQHPRDEPILKRLIREFQTETPGVICPLDRVSTYTPIFLQNGFTQVDTIQNIVRSLREIKLSDYGEPIKHRSDLNAFIDVFKDGYDLEEKEAEFFYELLLPTLQNSCYTHLVHREDGRPVSCISSYWHPTSQCAVYLNLAVKQTHRKKGIGTAMMNRAMALNKQAGAKYAVGQSNTASQGLHVRNGFAFSATEAFLCRMPKAGRIN
jgi:GNAT superfamily N-acetyltransferase